MWPKPKLRKSLHATVCHLQHSAAHSQGGLRVREEGEAITSFQPSAADYMKFISYICIYDIQTVYDKAATPPNLPAT